MYTGDNEIAIQSRNWLVGALLDLMKTTPYKKISIKDICIAADLSRQTFYNFFNQKSEILDYWLYEQYKKSLSKISANKSLTIFDITVIFSDYFENNEELLQIMIEEDLENIISNTISICITEYANTVIQNIKSTDTCKYVNAFLTGAIVKTLICWFKDSKKLSTDEFSSLLTQLLSGIYYQEEEKGYSL